MASPERMLLSSMIKSREAYDTVRGHLTDKDLNEQSALVVRHVDDYYNRDPDAQSVDPDLLAQAIGRSLSSPKHRDLFGMMVKELAAMDTSPANVVASYFGMKREAVGNKLASALASGKGPEDVQPLIAEYSSWCDVTELETPEQEIVRGLSVQQLISDSYGEGSRISVFPKALNERLGGGLLRGHHVVVFARPEVGKTMFVINMLAGFLRQNLTVLYVGNEDPLNDVVMRIVGRLTNRTRDEILQDPDGADALARKKGYDNLILASLAPGTPQEIEKLMEEYSPDVVIVDQLRNVNVREEHVVQKLEKAATALRTLGKKHEALMVSVTQAGDSATNKAILEMGDVDSSNTGIPASADVMIGIGMTPEDEAIGRRVLSLPKNKPGANHSYFPVLVNPAISKLASL